MIAFYNDNDPMAAEWLIDLSLGANLIPRGVVDRRSIMDIKGADLGIYQQCHFFAGIGGWPYALQLAGWPADREVWTGSCPCQPFSCAGKQKGTCDERHLWPEFLRLIAERRPATIFGEQVASRLGREWLAGVRADLEALGYAVGAAGLPAACVSAPHKRLRLFFGAVRLGQSDGERWESREQGSSSLGYGDSSIAASGWGDSVVLLCRKWRSRRVPSEPAFFPLAHGIPGRVAQLRGLGNAIVPQIAATFVRAFMEVIG